MRTSLLALLFFSTVVSAQPAPEPALTYVLDLVPETRKVHVEATWLGGSLGDSMDWTQRQLWGELEEPAQVDSVWQTAEGVRYQYRVEVPLRETENSPDASFSTRRLRSWGWALYRYPGAVDSNEPVSVRVRAPGTWQAATPFGDAAAGTVRMPSLEAAVRTPMVVAPLRLTQVDAGAYSAALAVLNAHPVPDSVFAFGFEQLVRATDAYMAGQQNPDAIFVGIDLLEGKPTYAPGNSETVDGVTSFLVLQHGNQPSSTSFWGTIAHEYLHAWMPAPFVQIDASVMGPDDDRLRPWIREGFTNYLGYRIAHEAGLLTAAQLAESLTEDIRTYASYSPDEPLTGRRGYVEGMVIGLGLDVALLDGSDQQANFRDWYRILLKRHAGQNATPLSRQAMRQAAVDLGGTPAGVYFDSLTSEQPTAVLRALDQALAGTRLLTLDEEGRRVVQLADSTDESAPVLARAYVNVGLPTRAATRKRLNVAYEAGRPYRYPIIPSRPIRTAQLSDFDAGLSTPTGAAWTQFSYGTGSTADLALKEGALHVDAQTGEGYTGAGIELEFGSPDESADLSAYTGLEIDLHVEAGRVALQFTSSNTGRTDRPAVTVESTEGRQTLRLPFSKFEMRAPVAGWPANVTALQLLTRGFGAQAATFTVYSVRLFE
ncbi:MAG: hypothetical protein AAGI08_01540 [Bacteroidota bacterium]